MRKLFKITQKEYAILEAISAANIYNRVNFEQAGKKMSVKPAPKDKQARYYELIPNNPYGVLEDMFQIKKLLPVRAIHKQPKYKFLDVGSGVGNIMALASIVGWASYGIEYEEAYKKVSNWNVKHSTTYMDALNYNGYNKYDIIYFYHPILTDSLMIKLLQIIDSQIKKGTILMCYPASSEVERELKKLWKPIFHKNYNLRVKK